MNRNEAQAIIAAFVKMRESATDEQALAVPVLFPAWKPEANYVAGERVLHNGILFKVLQDHTSQDNWTPDNAASLFAKVLIPDADVVSAWEQTDSTNTYAMGDKVTHNGKTWVSDYNNNSWEPGIFGWTEVIEQC